jgi:hypothetical protein
VRVLASDRRTHLARQPEQHARICRVPERVERESGP